MKRIIQAVVLLLNASTVFAASTDGTIDFTSQVNPVFDFYGFGPLANQEPVVQLFWAPVGSASFAPVSGTPVHFLTGTRAGFWDASSEPIVTTPGLVGGSQVTIIAVISGGKAVDSTGNGLWHGTSSPITITTGNAGSPATPAASISALPSFVATLAIPEPAPLLLGLLGAGVTLFFRRRRIETPPISSVVFPFILARQSVDQIRRDKIANLMQDG